MVRKSTLTLGAVGVVLAGVAARSLAASRTKRVPYVVVDHVGDVEVRRYPRSVVVETTAATERAAFGRLFRYISGANRADAEVSMTAPVETGESIAMTAPVETDGREGGVRMAFYLPASYDYEAAPAPTDPDVRLVEVPERLLAVRGFSWWTTDRRVESQTADLLVTLDDEPGLTAAGDPFLLRYDPPWTLPFLRTNEVAVEVRRTASPEQ